MDMDHYFVIKIPWSRACVGGWGKNPGSARLLVDLTRDHANPHVRSALRPCCLARGRAPLGQRCREAEQATADLPNELFIFEN